MDAQNVEDELEGLENALEDAILQKEALEQKLEETNQTLEDLRLDTQAQLLEREIRIAELECTVLDGDKFRNAGEKKDGRLQEALSQLETYKKAFECLKVMHMESSTQLAERNYELRVLSVAMTKLEKKLATSSEASESLETVVSTLQAALLADDEVFKQNEETEEILKERVTLLNHELTTYKKAWEDLGKVMKNREKDLKQQVSELSGQVGGLKEKLQVAETYVIPRWQIAADNHKKNGGSLESSLLQLEIGKVDVALEKCRHVFLLSCVPSSLWSSELRRVELVMSVFRCIAYGGKFLIYLKMSHFHNLVQDFKDNPLSVAKDKGFVRWLQQTTMTVSKLIDLCCRFAYRLKEIELPEFEKTMDDSFIVAQCIPLFEEKLKRLCAAASSDNLSSALDITIVNAMIAKLEDHSDFAKIAPPIQEFSLTKSPGILVPCVASLLFRLMGVTVLSYCKATYSDTTSLAIDSSIWNNLWQAMGHTVDSMLKNVNDVFEVHFGSDIGLLSSRIDITNFFRQFESAVINIERVMCAVEDLPADDVKATVMENLLLLLQTLPEIESMCVAYVNAPPSSDSDAFLTAMSSFILDKLSNVVVLEEAVACAKSDVKTQQVTITSLQSELADVNGKFQDIRKSLSEKILIAERYEVVDSERQQLRQQTVQFTTILQQQGSELSVLKTEKESLSSQNAEISKFLLETKRALELAKKIPKHQHQAEWDAMEIMHLRAVVRKLNRELYFNQLKGVAVDLEPTDLEKYVCCASSPTTDAGKDSDTKTRQDSDVLFGGASQSPATDNLHQIFGDAEELEADSSDDKEHIKEFNCNSRQIVDEFQTLQRSAWMHALTIPFLQPDQLSNGSQPDTPLQRYKKEGDALMMSIAILKRRTEGYVCSRVEASASRPAFGDHMSVAASRYLRSFKDLKLMARQEGTKFGTPLPIAKIKVPQNCRRVNMNYDNSPTVKLLVTDDQFFALHRKLIGT